MKICCSNGYPCNSFILVKGVLPYSTDGTFPTTTVIASTPHLRTNTFIGDFSDDLGIHSDPVNDEPRSALSGTA